MCGLFQAVNLSSLVTLEYPKILEALAGHTSTPMGRALALGLRPFDDLDRLNEALKDFLELEDAVKSTGPLPLSGISDLRPLFRKAAPRGAWLTAEEFVEIRSTLVALKGLGSITDRTFSKSYPRTTQKIDSLSDYRELLARFDSVFDERGAIKDDASGELLYIRGEIASFRKRARTLLERLIKDKRFKGLFQDEPFTIRDDRYVVAVKAGGHAKIRGVIHGRSATGATYFVEPFELVEVNNSLAVLKKEERAEEIRILKELTASVLERREDILKDLDTASELDLVQAKALFSRKLGCIVPEIRGSGGIRLLGARHPLLVMKEIGGGGKVVPVDIIIDENTRVLVISGANTGGKTVALKTIGLLTLMVQSAIPVPVEEGSFTLYFNSVFADIGDRQDILASLSTFSSHLKQVKDFLSNAGPGSLVLIDEIGVGTDPSEGAALSVSVLEALKNRGALCVVTTHLNLLKAHAQNDPSFMNASVEFDEETLKPLYRLRYGLPGPSLGLSIAKDFGIPSEIIESAKRRLEDREALFLESIRAVEEERARLEAERARLEELAVLRKRAVERLREDRGRLVQRAREKMDRLIEKAEEDMQKILEELKRAGRREAAARRVSRALEELRRKAPFMERAPRPDYVPRPGDAVELSTGTSGLVLKVDREQRRAEVAVGNLKVWVPYERLKRGAKPQKRVRGRKDTDWDVEEALSLNIVGMRVDEALRSVERFLDNAHVRGLKSVEIIHGVGTGALRRAVEDLLRRTPFVKNFYLSDISKGGVTVVELR